MSETADQLDQRLHNLHYGEGTGQEVAVCEIGIAKAVALTRIAVALEAIEATGVYVYQQGTEDPLDEQRSGRRQG